MKKMRGEVGLASRFFAGLFITVLLVCVFSAAFCPIARAATTWSKAYGGAGYDIGTGETVQTSDGGYAVSGDTNSSGAGGLDILLFKVDAMGNMLWSKTYGGNSDEISGDMCYTRDGGFAINGGTYSFGVGNEDFWLVKTDANGNMQWNKTYGGTGLDYAMHIVQSSDGGYALLGYTNSSGDGDRDFWLLKTDTNGNLLWNRTYGGNGSDSAAGLVLSGDGGYVMSGFTNSFGAGGNDVWVVKADASGNIVWNRTWGGNGTDNGYDLCQTSDGGFAFTGYTTSFGGYKVFLVKMSTNGNIQWNQTYAPSATNIALHLIQTSDGGYAMVGWNYANGQDFLLVKTDANGNLQWTNSYGGPKLENAYAVLQSSDGGYLLTGNTASFGAGSYDVWLVKTDSFGTLTIADSFGALSASAFSSATVWSGWTWHFSVHGSGGVPPYTFQWYEVATLLTGQTSMVLAVSKNTPGTFNFYCKVTDSTARTANSNNVTLTVAS